jgi:hypothetical protein
VNRLDGIADLAIAALIVVSAYISRPASIAAWNPAAISILPRTGGDPREHEHRILGVCFRAGLRNDDAASRDRSARDLLDAISPDPEAEPSFGWTEQEARWNHYGDHSAEGTRRRFRASLGSVDGLNQQGWAAGNWQELEDEDDGREPDEDGEPEHGWTESEARTGQYPTDPKVPRAVQDGEPSLGSLETINQTRWSAGCRDDREEQCDDERSVDPLEPDYEDGFDRGVGYVPASRGTSPLWDGPRPTPRPALSALRASGIPEIDPRSPVWRLRAPVA